MSGPRTSSMRPVPVPISISRPAGALAAPPGNGCLDRLLDRVLARLITGNKGANVIPFAGDLLEILVGAKAAGGLDLGQPLKIAGEYIVAAVFIWHQRQQLIRRGPRLGLGCLAIISPIALAQPFQESGLT